MRRQRDREKRAGLAQHVGETPDDQVEGDVSDEQIALRSERREIGALPRPAYQKQVPAQVFEDQRRDIRRQAGGGHPPGPDDLAQSSVACQ